MGLYLYEQFNAKGCMFL